MHLTKKAFLYIYSTSIELVLNYIVELFSHQCLATKRTLQVWACVEGHLKSLRLQPGKGAGEKRSNEEGRGGHN